MVFCAASLFVLLAFPSATGGARLLGEGAAAPADTRRSADQLLAELLGKYGQNEKRYEALAKRLDKEVRKTVAALAWLGAGQGGQERRLGQHPFLLLSGELAAAARFDAKKKAEASPLLARYPWRAELQLAEGVRFGSDRAIPSHENGFIELGSAPEAWPGYPELAVNQYLFGLQEIVGWRNGVESKKKLVFQGRSPKEAAGMETELPAWEAIRVHLRGSLPEVPLFAIPRLTHAIHVRLAERRRTAPVNPAGMDEFFALLDSKWNGFRFTTPFAKEPCAIVQPLHALITDRNGLVYRFPPSAELAGAGDIPFVSIVTMQEYARIFRGEELALGDMIRKTPEATAAMDAFWSACTYLARYRMLIDAIVRAVLAPNLRYPAYLSHLDYPEGKSPEKREVDSAFDVPRKHALLVWAYVGKDPVKLADYLHDNLLDVEANRFPADVALPVAFTLHVREREAQLLEGVAERVAAERGEQGAPGDFEHEFSPHPTYLDPAGAPASDYLLQSFHAFHGTATGALEDAARALVQQELDK